MHMIYSKFPKMRKGNNNQEADNNDMYFKNQSHYSQLFLILLSCDV